MRTVKYALLIIACLILPVNMMASNDYIPTSSDVNTSLQAIIDATMSAVASYLATPQLQLPGCDIRASVGKNLPDSLSFRDSDLAMYLPVLRPEPAETGSWLQRLLSKASAAVSNPLATTAASLLENNGWRRGDMILAGDMGLWFPDGTTVASLMALLVSPKPDETTARVSVDITLRGNRLGGPVRIQGDFILEVPQRGVLVITPRNLLANGLACEGGRIRIGMSQPM